ncbi:phospholipase [Starkeya sp. ORNL1]|uniref:alkaline phosphatase family protein n=1 Tax=Starkeya sp. ORNL1 TaxID=2709380 RepID=UPI0014632FC5|nr:alkaline phosphatase family protein [Starkeya sp. ORNL1]QJP13568.1 phospholipase [Starkeya sp. ORNL1]
MARKYTRRRFVGLAGGLAAMGAASHAVGETAPQAGSRLPAPADAPFDTVVVLMMENRSFDHVLGWLPGANGRQQGLSFLDTSGAAHETWPLGPDFQGCPYDDPDHTWPGIAVQYAEGRCDGFLKTAKVGDRFPIGYYREDELPILSALAKGYTTFDAYFSSMMGPTWENRLFALTGTTQLDEGWCDFPRPGERRPVLINTSIFDRVREAGLSAGYYYHDSPVTGLFASKRYDDISHPIEKFWTDARAGKLANVVFVDPDYTDRAEDMGTSNDYHPWGNLLVAEGFLAQVHDTLKASPQWDRMVFVLNFDEHGGFYDHVPPPACQDDTKLAGSGPLPDLKRLGFRVPAIAMGPFAPRKVETSGPYEHCSILKMIEWRWGLEPMTTRDRHARNLAEALDFTTRRAPIDLPRFDPPPARACAVGGGWLELNASKDGLVKIVCEGSAGAACTARLVALEGDLQLARAPVTKFRQASKLILELKLTKQARALLASGASRMPVMLETTVMPKGGATCRSVFSSMLNGPPVH